MRISFIDHHYKNYKDLVKLFSNKNKKNLKSLFRLNSIISLIDPLQIFLVGFLIIILTQINLSNSSYGFLNNFLPKKIFENINFSISISIILSISIIFLNLLRIYVLKKNFRTFSQLKIELSNIVFKNLISQGWLFYIENSSSILTKQVRGDTARIVDGYLLSILNLFINFIKFILVLITLIIVDYFITIFLILFGLSIYFFVIKKLKSKIEMYGLKLSEMDGVAFRKLMNSFNGMKLIILKNYQNFFLNYYSKVNTELQDSRYKQKIYTTIPNELIKLLVFSIVLIIFFMLFFAGENIVNKYSATLAMFILGSSKLFQSLGALYSNFTTMTSALESYKSINKTIYSPEKINFNSNDYHNISDMDFIDFNELNLEDVSFSYKNSISSIDKINLNIKKGEIVGLTGPTGSGKSTLIDIITCLIEPDKGNIIINNIPINSKLRQLWKNSIMYVPQASFFLEDTLIKNIAFAESNKDIDTEKVKKCLNLVDLNSKVESLPLKLQTIVSGGGLNFSGGERQRLLLARALYNQFEFIILDEATSALDYKTEKKILTNLKQLNKTTLLISHDQKILAECDKVYFLENGKIIKKKLHEYF